MLSAILAFQRLTIKLGLLNSFLKILVKQSRFSYCRKPQLRIIGQKGFSTFEREDREISQLVSAITDTLWPTEDSESSGEKYRLCCNSIGRYFTIPVTIGRCVLHQSILLLVVLRDFNNNRGVRELAQPHLLLLLLFSARTTLSFDLR